MRKNICISIKYCLNRCTFCLYFAKEKICLGFNPLSPQLLYWRERHECMKVYTFIKYDYHPTF